MKQYFETGILYFPLAPHERTRLRTVDRNEALNPLVQIHRTPKARSPQRLTTHEAEWRRVKLEQEGNHCQTRELADLAIKAFELSQVLEDKCDSADIPEKRAILEILCLNYTFDGVSLRITMRKPFDVLSKGLHSKDGSGGRI